MTVQLFFRDRYGGCQGEVCWKSVPGRVVPHMAVGGTPLRVFSPAARFSSNNGRRLKGLVSIPALGTQDGTEPTCSKVLGKTEARVVQRTTTLSSATLPLL